MAISVCEAFITERPLHLPPLAGSGAAGAVVDFLGFVRALEEGAELEGIRYEAHPRMAEHQMRRVGQAAADQYGVGPIVIGHRVGFVGVGEASIIVRVESRHRAEAFRANQWIMDEIKRSVPIWKHPVFKTNSAPREGRTDLMPATVPASVALA